MITLNNNYNVTVIKLLHNGVIVKLDDDTTEFIHVSQISDNYVKDPADYLSLDDTLTAICITGLDGKDQLSLKHLHLKPIYSSNYRRHKRSTNHNDTSKVHTTMSLDDMIYKANKDYLDKFRHGRKSKKH